VIELNLNDKFCTLGMKKEWIRTEEEKCLKRIQSEKNRRRKNSQQKVEVCLFILFYF
jgi:hypothetical protein